MVSRSRLKSFLTGLALYTMAAAMVGYFGVNAYTGKYGLNARQELDQEIIALTSELARLKRPGRPRYARRARALSARLRQSARSGSDVQSELIVKLQKTAKSVSKMSHASLHCGIDKIS
jgi:hypothetical protein